MFVLDLGFSRNYWFSQIRWGCRSGRGGVNRANRFSGHVDRRDRIRLRDTNGQRQRKDGYRQQMLHTLPHRITADISLSRENGFV